MIEKRIIGKKTIYVNIIENEDGSITEQYFDDLIDILITEKNEELKEKLQKEKKEFEEKKKEWNESIRHIDIIVENPNFLSTCSSEEKDAYLYLRNNNMTRSKKALRYFIESYRWKNSIYPSIKNAREEKIRKEEERELRKKQIKYSLIVIGIFLTLIFSMVACSL